jgi:hypothetical protein
LVFEYCDLLFKVLREQWSCFQAQYKVLMLKPSGKGPAGAERNAGPESYNAEASERKESPKRKLPKARPKKYYAVAVGRTTGVFTTWDEADRSVSKYSGSTFKSFKHRSEAKAWLEDERRLQRRRRRRGDSRDDSSDGDRGRKGRSRERQSRPQAIVQRSA